MSAPAAITSSSGCATSRSVVASSWRKASMLSSRYITRASWFAAKSDRRYTPQAMHRLQNEIERLYAAGALTGEAAAHARAVFQEFRDALTRGEIRAAEKQDGRWRVNAWVKQGILLGFRLGELTAMDSGLLSFVDKDTFPARQFTMKDKVRVVPGGSAVRQGAYLGPGV